MSVLDCMWTAWGEVVCKSGREQFVAAVPPPVSCAVDSDCDSQSRCGNLNANSSAWACRPCSDIGCAAGKACAGSADCAEGLSCQNGICTIGGVSTRLNNSSATITRTDTDTVGQSYEHQRQANMYNNSSGHDCAMFGTCQQGSRCEGSSQCAVDLMCDAGVCKTSYSGLLS